MVGQQHARGELIARGNTSDVWEWTAATVVKVLRPEIPRHWAALEAGITRRVHEAGLPVPATEGVVEVGGHPGIVLERIDGPSMWSRMKADPAELPRLVELLVDLQSEILAAGPLDGLPDLVTRLHAKIDEADQLPASECSAAQDLLAGLPVGSALCHGDMHPANILMSVRGPVVVDWFDAAIGYPLADLARSSLLMPPASGLGSANRHLDGATIESLARLHDAYLATLTRRDLIDAASFDAWEAVLAVARMSEPVQTADLHGIWRHWRARSLGPAQD
jgi:aminoglycoside phosphotransferase (APT) family kinase protein